ncbi:MAG: DMT family transporter, partial [Acutalibacteraceae bacterium]|nr:DMT family transporter [Acutalibacteraceae bacterium]
FILAINPKLLKVPKKEIFLIICSGTSQFLASYTYFASMKASSVSTAVILMYTAPVFVLIYSVIFLGEKLNIVKGITIFLMIVGCALVSGIVGGIRFSLVGVLFGIASGISYSAYNILTKILTIHKVNAVTVTSYNFIMVGIIGLAVSDPVEIIWITSKEPIAIIPLIIGIGVLTCVLPYLFYTFGLRDIPAGTASAMGIIEPLSATVFSVAFLGEVLTVPLVIGMVLILSAVFVLAKQK